MSTSAAPQAKGPRAGNRFLVVSACYAGLICAVVLILSSLIHHGHGMLGVSSAFSIGIVAGIGAAAVLGLGRLIAHETAPGPAFEGCEVRPSRRKCELEFDEWFAILEEAKSEFYVAGHTMGKWCDRSRKDIFLSQLRRILATGGNVTLVMLGPRSPQLPILKQATGKDYSARIADTASVLDELAASLAPEHRAGLRVKKLEDEGAIPYMVVGNEWRLVTATYLARTDSDDMPCIELERENESARAIYDDFHKLAAEPEAVDGC